MKKKITIDKIAEMAGVNSSTVSRALNPATANRISAVQREKIIRICDELNYRPRASARAFASGRTSRIVLILADIVKDFLTPSLADYIAGLSFQLQKYGYSLAIHALDWNVPDKEKWLQDFLRSEQGDGYILGSGILDARSVEIIKKLKQPVFQLAHHRSISYDIPAIITNDAPAVRMLLQRIPGTFAGRMLLCGVQDEVGESMTLKFQTIRQALSELNMPEDTFETRVFRAAVRGSHINRSNAVAFAETNLDYLKKFSFIWCDSDLTALGIADVLARSGVVPGKDVMFAGFDNIERISGEPHPFMTTIDYRRCDGGIATADMLIAVLQGKRDIGNVVTDSVYTERESFCIMK